jgi:anti-anti-sigma factor
MLRILPAETEGLPSDVGTLRLVGQISGEWVAEVRRVCTELLTRHAHVCIDMTEVSFVDADGLRLLRELAGRVSLVHCALFVAEQLKTA